MRWYQPSWKLLTPLALVCGAVFCLTAHADETIVILRHAEKPPAGLGQLSCKGFNRSLALPNVLISTFGQPDMIVVPNPSIVKKDAGVEYAYIRPLATIEPTAIVAGKSINTEFGFNQTEPLVKFLLQERFADATVLVVWEHHQIEKIVKDLLKSSDAKSTQIPTWEQNDFDSMYVIKIHQGENALKSTSFDVIKQQLNNQPDECQLIH